MPTQKVLNKIVTKKDEITTVYKIGDVIEGYYDSTSGKFYEESTHITEIEGASGFIYVDLADNGLYIYKESTSSFVSVGGGGGTANNIKFGYLNSTDGKFYEDDQYTIEITADPSKIYIDLADDMIYRYDALLDVYVSIGDMESIIYVNSLPSSGIRNVIYGISTKTAHSAEIATNFLDDNDLFEKEIDISGEYTYIAKPGVEIEASADGTTYKEFASLMSDGVSDWTLTFADGTSAILVDGDTFYYKEIVKMYYAGDAETQTITEFASAGGGGAGEAYYPGEGVDVTNHIISVTPASPSLLGGVKIDDNTIKINASNVIRGNYQGGYGVNVNGNEISAKTFVGTTAEWNTLTPAQQAGFDTVSITDDGSAGNNTPGHEIVNNAGTTLPQRSQFKVGTGLSVIDDSTNDMTKVEATPYTAGRKIDITNYEVAADETLKGTFVGTKAQWNALSTAEKAEYEVVNFTDDESQVNLVVDTVADGNMNAVTSNAVADALALKQNITDNTLNTSAKTVPGAINELKSKKCDAFMRDCTDPANNGTVSAFVGTGHNQSIVWVSDHGNGGILEFSKIYEGKLRIYYVENNTLIKGYEFTGTQIL